MEKTKHTSRKVATDLKSLIAAVKFELAEYKSERDAAADGFYSLKDYADAVGCCTSTARQKLDDSCERGEVERVKVKSGRSRAYFYRAAK
jgi:hypothetical protein